MKAERSKRLIVLTSIVLGTIALGVGGWIVASGGASKLSLLSPGPLSKGHAELEGEANCAQCHVPGGGLSDSLCLDCHEPLAQRIAAKKGFHAGVEAACDECHSEHHGLDVNPVRWPVASAPFRPVQAGVGKQEDFPHSEATGFTLEGAHAELECAACHKQELVVDAGVLAFEKDDHTFLGLAADCSGCHQDAHTPSLGADCAQCHETRAWSPAAAFEHAKARFPLEGKHRDVACEECHVTPAPAKAAPASQPPVPSFVPVAAKSLPRPFRGVGFGEPAAKPVSGAALPECASCHENPHSASERFQRCDACHSPKDWRTIDGSSFDHAATGFPLEGQHAQVSCADCHGADMKKAVQTSCASCHEDDHHQGAFDREMALVRQSCDRCHDARDWKRSTYAASKHPLPLIEGHAVRCEQCHGGQASFPRLPARGAVATGPLEERCAACHQDPHQGRLSQDCASCHGFKAFHLADLDRDGHAKLGFPIVGAHEQVDCDGCHGGRVPGGGLRKMALTEVRAQGCVACHEDPHRGQLSGSCASCHSETEFAPSSFDLARHQRTRFPLQGAHRAMPCEVCHVSDLPGDVQRFRWPAAGQPPLQAGAQAAQGPAPRCAACHQQDDPHRGQFERDCGACHGVEDFRRATFGAADHARTGFPLDGPHAVDCARCHVSGLAHGPAITYAGTPRQCAECHLDVHAGQFAERQGGCQGCHRTSAWKPVTFDHDDCRFALSGAHAQLDCAACHLTVTREVGGEPRPVVHYFPIEARACDDCHVNPHDVRGGERAR